MLEKKDTINKNKKNKNIESFENNNNEAKNLKKHFKKNWNKFKNKRLIYLRKFKIKRVK